MRPSGPRPHEHRAGDRVRADKERRTYRQPRGDPTRGLGRDRRATEQHRRPPRPFAPLEARRLVARAAVHRDGPAAWLPIGGGMTGDPMKLVKFMCTAPAHTAGRSDSALTIHDGMWAFCAAGADATDHQWAPSD